jgi:hypothetical protein
MWPLQIYNYLNQNFNHCIKTSISKKDWKDLAQNCKQPVKEKTNTPLNVQQFLYEKKEIVWQVCQAYQKG